jgi:hypothetical protein
LSAAWRGTAARTGETEIGVARAALDEGTGRLYRARGALLALADELTALRTAVEVVRAGWLRAEGEVRGLQQAIRMSDCATVAPLQEELRVATAHRDAATATWGDQVRRADAATTACASALTVTVSGVPAFRPGRGVVTADLGEALGTGAMTSDDVFRARLDRSPDPDAAWAALGPAAQAFARATAGTLPSAAGGPALRSAWFGSRNWAEQQAVLHDDPQAVGAADGLPASVRHQANLLVLDRREEELAALIAAPPSSAVEGSTPAWSTFDQSALVDGFLRATFQRERDSIRSVRLALTVPRSQPVFLLNVDPAGRGRAVIAIGDPDTAAHVATYVPGTGSDIGSLGGELDRVDAWAAGGAAHGTRDVAAIAWVGYESPSDVVVATRDAYADAAAPALTAFQQGLRVAHQGTPANTTVVAHSYGSSVVAAAASGGRSLAADRLVLVASTGLELTSVTDLRLDGVSADEMHRRVFALMHANDFIQYTGLAHGGSPYAADFGGQVMVTDGYELLPDGADPGLLDIRSPFLDLFHAHGAYQHPGSVEQRAISALIVDAPVPVR